MWKITGAILILAAVTAIGLRHGGEDRIALAIAFLITGIVGITFLIFGMWKDDKRN